MIPAESSTGNESRARTAVVNQLQQVSGIWTALELMMMDRQDRTRTEMSVTRAEYDVGLSEADFTRRTLEQGAQ